MPTDPSIMTTETTLADESPLATSLSSQGIRESWDERIKAHSIFSARTTSQSYVDMLKKRLAEVASRQITPQRAEETLRRTLADLGYSPQTGFPDARGRVPPATPGDIRDLSSSRRIQLIIDTNVKQARSLGQIAASEDPMHLMMEPAWRLARSGARKKPRGDWRRRWEAAGAKVGWQGALRRQMVALKTSPIWQAIADGTGGFRDCIGSPYPPFAFGSGLGWYNVGRGEWRRLCAAEGVPDGLDAVTAKAKQLKAAKEAGGKGPVAAPSPAGGTMPAGGAGASWGVQGGPAATPPPLPSMPSAPAPEGAPFRADFSSRNAADDAVDDALAAARTALASAKAAANELAAMRAEAGKLAGDAPKGERRRCRDEITRYRSRAADEIADMAQMQGRIVNYGGAVGSTPVPRGADEQSAFDETMRRYGGAAERTAREMAAAAARVERLAAAGRLVMERMRGLPSEFEPSFASRDEAERAVDSLLAALGPAWRRWESRKAAVAAAEQALAPMMAEWPGADFSKAKQVFADARGWIEAAQRELEEEGRRQRTWLAAAQGRPAPADDASQALYDGFMRQGRDAADAARARVEGSLEGLDAATAKRIDGARAEADAAVVRERERLCADILAKAQADAAAALGTQVADMVAERRAEEKALGVTVPKGEEAERRLDLAHKACRRARTNVRQALDLVEQMCGARDVDGAKVAAVRLGNAVAYCQGKLGAMRRALDEYKTELVRVKAAAQAPAQAPAR